MKKRIVLLAALAASYAHGMQSLIKKTNSEPLKWHQQLAELVLFEDADGVERFLADSHNWHHATKARKKDGKTLLHIAAIPLEHSENGYERRVRIVKALLKAGARKHAKDNTFKTPYDYLLAEQEFDGKDELLTLLN